MIPIIVEGYNDRVYLAQDTLDSAGRLLPPVPSKPFPRADVEYAVGKTLTLTLPATLPSLWIALRAGVRFCPPIPWFP
jgi:hypothetical protein